MSTYTPKVGDDRVLHWLDKNRDATACGIPGFITYDSAEATCTACRQDAYERLRDEIDRLQQWKREATIVIERWDALWDLLGQPGRIGEFRQTGVHDEIVALRQRLAETQPILEAAEAWTVAFDTYPDERDIDLVTEVQDDLANAVRAWLAGDRGSR